MKLKSMLEICVCMLENCVYNESNVSIMNLNIKCLLNDAEKGKYYFVL